MAFALYKLLGDYPRSSITPYARRVLESVNEEYHLGLVLTELGKKEAGEKPEVKKETLYLTDPNAEHFVMIVCETKTVRIDPLLVRISDFNKKEHRTRTFNVKSVVLDDARTMITIGNFEGQQKAADYITSMQLSDYVFGGIDKAKYKIVPISVKNYPLFYQSKNLDEYTTFYESNINNKNNKK